MAAAHRECLRTSCTRPFTADACSSAGAAECGGAPPSSSPCPRPRSRRRCNTSTAYYQFLHTDGAFRSVLPASTRQASSSLCGATLTHPTPSEEDCTHRKENGVGAAGLTRSTADRRRSTLPQDAAGQRTACLLTQKHGLSATSGTHLYSAIAASSACTACRVSTSAPAARLMSSQASRRCLAMPCLQRKVPADHMSIRNPPVSTGTCLAWLRNRAASQYCATSMAGKHTS